jgi:hypothetical protein
MLTYFEFKDFFCKLLRNPEMTSEGSDIVIDLSKSRYKPTLKDENIQFTIKNDDLFSLYTKVTSMRNDGIELFSDENYEIAVDFNYPIMRNHEVSSVIEDKVNGIHYELNIPSLEYSIFLIIKLLEAYKEKKIISPWLMRLRVPIEFFRNVDDFKNITLEMLLPRMIGELSLKIRTNSIYTLPKFRNLITSFSFEFMYLSDISIVEFKDVGDIFRANISPRNTFDINQLDTPPVREYKGDVIDYYKLALSSNDPYIKYISFYHVMEYYFDDVFKRKLIEDLKSRITHPAFSYKNDDKIYDVALFIKNRLKMDAQNGQGNELESLKFVLNEFVTIDELKNRINSIDDTALTYYQDTKVCFCNAPVINWCDMQGIVNQLAKRIYFTRNSLVHSKSSKNDERYRPYKNEPQLQKEIPLVRAAAELIIINSSKLL